MQKILITGASSWLWYIVAKKFLDEWYEVICLGRHKPELKCTHIPVDFSHQEQIVSCVESIIIHHTNFSAVVCCAGIGYIEWVDQVDYTNTQEMFQVNIIWQSYLLSELSETIIQQWTDIVFVGATIWYKANEFMPLYGTSKRALRGLAENRRAFLKNTACRVLHISPWWMDTESNIWPQGRETIIAQKTGKNLWTYLSTTAVADFIRTALHMPKNMEIAEVIINRK